MEDLTTFQGIYGANGDAVESLFQTFPTIEEVGKVISAPIRIASGAVTGIVNNVTGTIRGTYFYLIGGIVIIGILAIFVLGAGTKFMSKVQGG